MSFLNHFLQIRRYDRIALVYAKPAQCSSAKPLAKETNISQVVSVDIAVGDCDAWIRKNQNESP